MDLVDLQDRIYEYEDELEVIDDEILEWMSEKQCYDLQSSQNAEKIKHWQEKRKRRQDKIKNLKRKIKELGFDDAFN